MCLLLNWPCIGHALAARWPRSGQLGSAVPVFQSVCSVCFVCRGVGQASTEVMYSEPCTMNRGQWTASEE
eukprot:6177287-Lingulodinium_polyedra.AAC.1